MEQLDRWIARLSLRLSVLAQIGLAAVMILIISNIFLRRFYAPVPGTVEMVEILGALILGCSIAYCLYNQGHVFVNVLVQKLPLRIQAAVDIFTRLLMLAASGVLCWQLVIYTQRMMERGLSTGHLGIPIWPVIAIVALGFVLLSLVIINELIKAAVLLLKGDTK